MVASRRMAADRGSDFIGRRCGEGDPSRRFFAGKPQELFKRGRQYVLRLPLPLVNREEVHLHRSVFDELVIRIGNWKRNVSLPIGLAKLEIAGAKYEDDRLNIFFATDDASDVVLAEEELKPSRWESLKARFGRK